tara:strand:+ start:507 stop:1547 length:1041 start_codon:yes stop_codon:yes gene_type:complete
MAPYWFLFLVPLVGVFSTKRFDSGRFYFFWAIAWVFVTLIVGLRHEVGADWYNYVRHFEGARSDTVYQILISSDQAYYLINFVFFKIGATVHMVNLFCAGLSMFGIIVFCRNQPLPWLAFLVAVPYFIIVVSMGYTRQATALGFVFLALSRLDRDDVKMFIVWTLVGALFHKSAVLMLPVAALASTRRPVWAAFWVGLFSLGASYFLLFDAADELWQNYVVDDYDSEGGLIRILMNAIPASLFLAFKNKLAFQDDDQRLWSWMSIFSLCCVPLVLISSAATDRVALYFIPVQIYVFARLPVIVSEPYLRALIVSSIVVYYFLVQLVWLNFASHSYAWLPYQMYPIN